MPIKMNQIPESIEGARKVVEWFGYWPVFHDAEVLELHLDRQGPSWISFYTWHMSETVDDQGQYILDKHAIVRFVFDKISDLGLDDFSSQNVIAEVVVSRRDNDLHLAISPCYGIGGFLQGTISRIELLPGKPI
jgi:hypothetical protein